ncbi:unnamed protein product [Dibothriocephalus latus]|uniref:Uncharacterized protein n=1 Tax=Dibothriocephalus latus TaxID=60516 RepID=A0A3P7NQ68_DIBLA|nr:unnamed protein product [Dibothriocephalus latus]
MRFDLPDDGKHLAFVRPQPIRRSVLWRLPLSSPLVDLFTVYSPPLMEQQSGTPLAPVPGTRSLAAVPITNTAPPQYPHNDQQGQANSERSLPFAESLRPPPAYQLRRLIFTTYALDLNATFYVPHLPSYMEAALWEDKFCGTLNLV